ncbi:MAG: indolepyruvate ferredoxin oxidoreductase [Proteobacteria bacterium]|nr:indolepyruvate ferredoxin oxidoreductase [Pseudomonadota bacterium]
MPKLSEDLINPKSWSGLVTGNQALARAMIETNTRVVTTFPGSPTPEIALALTAIAEDERPFYFEYSLNEKVALEVATGASLNGHLSCVFFKSVGLNVAADSLIQLSMLELIGGMVIILGDDPGANSSQNEQDNRHFARMSYIPMLEPTTPTEAYEMYAEAVRLAQLQKAPIFVRTTTHVNHAKEVVQFGAITKEEPDWTPRFDVKNGPYIALVHDVFPLKRKALGKLAAFGQISEETKFNRVVSPNGDDGVKQNRLGLIASSLPILSLLENLQDSGAPINLLALGMTYPLPKNKIIAFLNSHDDVFIVEELDRVTENEIKAIAWDAGVTSRILVRTDMEDLLGELGPERTWKMLTQEWPQVFAQRPAEPEQTETVPRLAQMCPGCGHRSAFHAMKSVVPEGTITVADIGCHSLGIYPPCNFGEVLLCMGHSTATGAGLAIGNEQRKVVALLGDTTMFHAGIPGMINAVVNNHDITLVIMENGTTAMTGHQPRPGTGEVGEKIPLVPMLEALGIKFVRQSDTYNQAKLASQIKEAIEYKGFSVVIAAHPCMLKFTRQRQRNQPGIKLPKVHIDQDICDLSTVCIEQFGCPSFMRNQDGSISVNEELCIGDGSCRQTCPANAILFSNEGGAA